MKNIFSIILLCVALSVRAEVIDLSHDNNKNGQVVSTAVFVYELTPTISVVGIADTMKYGELYLGKTVLFGQFSFSPYIGIESVGTGSAKLRGMLVSSGKLDSCNFTSVIEFAGVTGNIHKEVVSCRVEQTTISAVRHSVAGTGIRLDYKIGSLTPYLQILEKRKTFGMVYNF